MRAAAIARLTRAARLRDSWPFFGSHMTLKYSCLYADCSWDMYSYYKTCSYEDYFNRVSGIFDCQSTSSAKSDAQFLAVDSTRRVADVRVTSSAAASYDVRVSASPIFWQYAPLVISPVGNPSSYLYIAPEDYSALAYNEWTGYSAGLRAASVDLSWLFGYAYAHHGVADTVTLVAYYADGLPVTLWAANVSTLYGVSLPQQVFPLDRTRMLSALVFYANARSTRFYVDPNAGDTLWALQTSAAAGPVPAQFRAAGADVDIAKERSRILSALARDMGLGGNVTLRTPPPNPNATALPSSQPARARLDATRSRLLDEAAAAQNAAARAMAARREARMTDARLAAQPSEAAPVTPEPPTAGGGGDGGWRRPTRSVPPGALSPDAAYKRRTEE